jgi:membrane associated rhomboid family serine protease
MFPIGDNNPPGRRLPIITYLLIGLNALVFLYELSLGQGQALESFFQRWGALPSAIAAAFANPAAPNSGHAFLTLITSQFIHLGWMHIIGNMLFLYIFGDDIEDLLGPIGYLLFYLVCGIVAGLVQTFVLVKMTGDANTVGIGASGAISGVMGAYMLLYPNRQVTVLTTTGQGTGRSSIPAYIMLGLWFVQQFLAGISTLGGASAGGVGFWAHIGGFVAGALLILPFRGRAQRMLGSGSPQQPVRQYR